MTRSRGILHALLGAIAVAAGCAHCDTCDDFPTGCTTCDPAGSYTPAFPTFPGGTEGTILTPVPTTGDVAPPTNSTTSPFNPGGAPATAPANGNSPPNPNANPGLEAPPARPAGSVGSNPTS